MFSSRGQFTASHGALLSNCTNLMLHNNSINQLTQGPSLRQMLGMFITNFELIT